jgi:hypothetical protein
MYKCHRYKQSLYLALLTCARPMTPSLEMHLWSVLSAYGVEPKVVELLADLHPGTQAAVKLAGEHGGWFYIGAVCVRAV